MKLRNYLAAAVAAAPLALVAGSASAGTFTYSGYNVVNNTNVVIQAGSVNGTFGSGQIDLVGSGPDAGKTFPTWCIDAFDDLQGSGTYNIVSPPFNNSGGDVTGQSIEFHHSRQDREPCSLWRRQRIGWHYLACGSIGDLGRRIRRLRLHIHLIQRRCELGSDVASQSGERHGRSRVGRSSYQLPEGGRSGGAWWKSAEPGLGL